MDYSDLLKFTKKLKLINTIIGNSKIKKPIIEEKNQEDMLDVALLLKNILKGEKITSKNIFQTSRNWNYTNELVKNYRKKSNQKFIRRQNY